MVVVSGTVLVLCPALVNGLPFFYFDSTTYIEQIAKALKVILPSSGAAQAASLAPVEPVVRTTVDFGAPEADRIVFSGRSVYYGLLAWIGWASSIWLPVVIQAATLSWLVVTLFYHHVGRWWWQAALLSLAGLGFLSSAGLFAGLVMPDIWAGFLVLSLALYWACHDRLSRGSRILILAILAFSVLAHNSHLLLLAALLGCIALARLFAARSDRAPLSRFILPLAALCIGVAGHLIYAGAVRVAYDAKLMSRPHITAHLVDLGPGTSLIRDSCPESGFALCAYADRLPVDWISFLFARDPGTGVFAAVPVAVQKSLIQEQAGFAVQTLIHYPVQTLFGLAGDGLSQLWTLGIGDVALDSTSESVIAQSFPPDLASALADSLVYDRPHLIRVLYRLIQISSAAAAVFLLCYAAWRGTRMGRAAPELERVILLMIAGLVLNALICGILASPYGRFQARIVWLLPLAAALLLSHLAASGNRAKRITS
jgi:hypothetical protein